MCEQGLDDNFTLAGSVKKNIVVQRRMPHSIVGWLCIGHQPWQNTMKKNLNMDVALTAHPARKRLARFLNSQSIFATHVARHKTACATQNYTRASLPPIGTKFGTKSFPKRRRPKQRWDDHFSEFAMQHLHNDNWIWIEARSSTWNMFGTLLGFFLPKPLQRLVLRLFSHVLMGPYSV